MMLIGYCEKNCMVLENCRTSDVKMNPERKNLSRT
jgi:hypothetical protein